jgi:hypothetical protein
LEMSLYCVDLMWNDLKGIMAIIHVLLWLFTFCRHSFGCCSLVWDQILCHMMRCVPDRFLSGEPGEAGWLESWKC